MRGSGLLTLFIIAIAGCGGDGDCRCTGDVPGGRLDIACLDARCIGDVGYRCLAKGQIGIDPLVCGPLPTLAVDLGVAGCVEGDYCDAGDCREGTISCSGGRASCRASANKRDGTACSTGICSDGVCGSCRDNQPCSTDGCSTGYTVCTAGIARCEIFDTELDGTSCGTARVCYRGTCIACDKGAACSLASDPCYDGVTSCTTGKAVCVRGNYKPNGTGCGAGKVCRYGSCQDCVDGSDCTPSGTCHLGKISCGSGSPVCVDQGGTVANGTSCGSGMVCKDSVCKYCSSGYSCTPSTPCKLGMYSCATGDQTCQVTVNAANGSSCGTNMVCKDGGCNACTANKACTPANTCKLGTTSCSTGVETCVETSTAVANGTSCGANQVCSNGACVACVADQACSTGDPCQAGKTSCATGSSRCEPSGPSGASSCGTVTAGTCSGGACVCPAGKGFYNNDCQACPAGNAGYYVNADPAIGLDNQCCGRTSTAGFGGPCRTLRQAIANAKAGSNTTITVTGDSQRNLSTTESYPIVIDSSVKISGSVCAPGASGKDVFRIQGTGVSVTLDGFGIGVDCQGTGRGANEGIYVGPGAVLAFSGTIAKVKNGIHVDGGWLTNPTTSYSNYRTGSITITDVSGDGILCRSDTDTGKSSTLVVGPLAIERAALHDVFASRGCVFKEDRVYGAYGGYHGGSMKLGQTPPCGADKKDAWGIWAEGNANVSVDGALVISCMQNDGVSLRKNDALAVNSPTVTLNGYQAETYGAKPVIRRSGCAGLYAEVGKLNVTGMTVRNNHWGVLQRSTASSTDPAAALIDLNVGSPYYKNVWACNAKTEPGACCTGASCDVGADVFNQSGLPLDAAGNVFEHSPVQVCNCSSALASCACAPASGTPPDGVDVLNAPLSGGTPTTDVTGFTTMTVDCTRD